MAADPRFFPAGSALTLAEAAAAAGGELVGGDPELPITGVGPLQSAGPAEVSFLDNRRYAGQLAITQAAAVVLAPEMLAKLPEGRAAIVTPHPYLGFGRIARALHPAAAPRPGIHPSAVVDASARIGQGVEVGPLAVIEAGAEIGAGCIIGPHAVIGAGVVLGEGCRIGAHTSLSHCIAGRQVVLHPGARVGQEGFGFAVTPEGRFETMPQLGRVLLGDFVELGANACVDRGSQTDTVLGAGTRLDNMVQIGHNVSTGKGCVLVAQVGIAGSTRLGNGVQMGGQSGISGHVEIGDRAQVAAQSGVMSDVAPGEVVGGSPAWPMRETLRAFAALRKLAGTKPPAKPTP
ncbi:UDP-3-O-(3-hydroxymyristoyl)glucosamine N-acyltransferase [Falsiroseomonas tokyonensis]|uniref:UDP-3-O-acylglucosamine N-acyltransferase n=1 Tax=Falsiroseomonas tokyonensis TaxID=430521 RepID=A0ABV7BU22_9PROT|nr:UDP-3-O-(3-hydroxymyristoyl)glucosamine N-acyltransferase [Falsiroseomonas tokyonensis]MBU8538122.1 UDP-3-O-(3-hydroxymyristoyl)glucosamine N-acyltransferase [Falsiroseomonas tokyonensis]